jgi:lipopolysaccharide biosynthesis regulator YciM
MRWLPRVWRGDARAPQDGDAAVRAALLAVLERDWAEAERLLVAAARVDSAPPETWLALGRLLRSRGELGRAIRLHQNLLLRFEARSAAGRAALAELAADFRAGGYGARAIASYEELLSHDAKHRGALRALVELHAEAGHVDRALELARRLARHEPRAGAALETDLRVRMAQAAQAQGRSGEARKALRRALRRDASCLPAWILLGEIEAERGRAKAALAAWSRVPRVERRSGALVYPKLEATYAALGRARDFEGFLRGLLAEEPGDAQARLALARHLAARGDAEAALAELRDLVAREPGNLEARVALGRLLLAEGRSGEAAAAHAELLAALEAPPAAEAGP